MGLFASVRMQIGLPVPRAIAQSPTMSSAVWTGAACGTLQNVTAFAGLEAVENAVLGLGELYNRVTTGIEQSERAKSVERPADDILGRWKQVCAISIDVEPVTTGHGLGTKREAADLIVIGVGKLPGPGHGVGAIARVRWLLCLRGAAKAARDGEPDHRAPTQAETACIHVERLARIRHAVIA